MIAITRTGWEIMATNRLGIKGTCIVIKIRLSSFQNVLELIGIFVLARFIKLHDYSFAKSSGGSRI